MMIADEFEVPFAIIERCVPPDLHARWQNDPLIQAIPFLPLAAGPVVWKISRVLQWFNLVAPEHFEYFKSRLEDHLSLPFVTFEDVAASLDPRNEWSERTLLNISRDYPNTLPTFRDDKGRLCWRVSDLARFHCRLYGRREPERTFAFEETLRDITRKREPA